MEIALLKVFCFSWKAKFTNFILVLVVQVATTLLVAGSTLTFWIPPFASTSSFKVLGCLCNCRQLAYSSFQLTHMSHDDHAIELIEPWRPRRRQNIITVLATLPQVWVYACKHQCTTAITRMWTKSLLVFFESYTAESCAQAMADNGETKGLITPPPRWVSAQLLYVCVTAW